MRLICLLLIIVFASCENPRFDRDNRQIIAKDSVRRKLIKARAFDITAFREDTVRESPDTLFKKPLLYTLDFHYIDSTGALQNKKGRVLFTPDGKSVIKTTISDE
ncbi:MAG: hypothetical protein JWN76_238 [Chitinophagaceae bacterium]|nr:hypothetical protein [Chitinophagaceae bacterium]